MGVSIFRITCGYLCVLFVACVGCTGEIGSTNAGGSTGAVGRPGQPGSRAGDPAGSGAVDPSDPNAAGPVPLARLNRREYNSTVHDLVGDDTNPADQFPDDKDITFLFRRAGLVAQQDADVLRTTAETLAATAVKNLSTLLPCDPVKAGEQACAGQFVDAFGLRAYRRPLAAEEKDHLMALYQTGRGTLQQSFGDSIGMLIEAILQSPGFLYHWESPYDAPVREGPVLRLAPYEVASRLSYFLWGSMPDKKLFDAAAANQLTAEADIALQVSRMLADPRARENVAEFFNQWLELDTLVNRTKDTTIYPNYDAVLQNAMTGETAAFVKQVVFDGDGRFETLLDAPYSFVNQPLGSVYGMTGVSGVTLQKENLDTSQRLGLLTQAAFLTLNAATDGSHPVRRGKAVYTKLLCGDLPPPPPGVPPAKTASSGGTTRQRFTEHDQNACAKSCHGLMDPIGFAFEHYDGIGAFRTMDNGGVVDSSGQVTLDGVLQTFNDAVQLTAELAKSATVRACFATQWLRFALGRTDGDSDGNSIAHSAAAFAQSNLVRDLLVGVATSRSFRYRSPADGEVLP